MEVPQLAVKTIPKGSFFELYNDLSHREPEKLPTPAPSFSSKTQHEDSSKNFRSVQLTPFKDTKVPKLSFYSEKIESDELPSKSFTRKRPPSELIAIDIPLKSSEETAEFAESQSSIHSSFNHSSSMSNYNHPFEVPKIPKSLNSFEKHSKVSSSSLKTYMDRLKDLDGLENSEDQMVEMLRNTKINSFDNILELIFSECNGKGKTRGCLFIKCGRDGMSDHQKLDFFYQTLGTVKFEISKLMHRCLLRKFLAEATQNEEVPSVASWKKIGFPDDINDFFSQTGSPLAFIMAIHVVEMISSVFWRSICEVNVPFLDICFQISIEAYQLSKLPKFKNFFSRSVVPNYFKLTAAGILSYFMVKTSKEVESLELLQKIIEQMKENHGSLIDSIDSTILKSSI